MFGSIKLACAALLGVAVISTCGVASAAAQSAGKPVKCTPKTHIGHLINVKGTNKQYQIVTIFPKGSGHIAVGGFCRVNAKGLGKSHKVFRDKPKKTIIPVTPTTPIVGNPVTPVTPVAPPVVVTPPVTPPAPPVVVTPPVVATPIYTCDRLTVNGLTPGVTALVAAHFTALNGANFVFATFNWGDGSSNTSTAASFNEADFAHSYTRSGKYMIVATVTFVLPDGSTAPATSIQCQQTVGVKVPVPTWKCTGLVVNGLSTGSSIALVAAHFAVTNGAVFDHVLFEWGDSSSNTTDASANNEADFAHIYPGTGEYPILATLFFRVPGTTDLKVATCGATATVL